MKESGLIRRLDNLGRIVIPKELRKVLSIKEGEPLEISLNENSEIVLNKTSVFKNLNTYLQIICETINEVLEISTIVTDMEKVICVSGISKNKCLNKDINKDLRKQIESKKSYISKNEFKTQMIQLFDKDENRYNWQLIMPIVVENIPAGSIIIFSCNDKDFPECGLKILEIITKIISKQLE